MNLASKKQPCTVGIDVGTSSVKAVLADANGAVLSSASAPCSVQHPAPAWAEVHPGQWWDGAVRAVRALEVAGRDVLGIGISVLYPALVLFDREMNPVRPAILYCDQRSAAESAELLARYGEKAARRLTGNAFPAGSASITSLLWVKKHEPQAFERTAKVGHANTFLVHRLTGEFAIDYSNASLSGLLDTKRNQWSAELCDLAGLTPAHLPRLMPGTAAAGALSNDAASLLGLPPGLPVAAGAGDTACSALGIGVSDEIELFLCCGSTNNFVRLARTPEFDNGLINSSWLDGSTWLNVGTTNASGAAVQWFVENYLGAGEYERFFELCGRSSPGAGGIVFLPYLAGERTPWYDPKARAVFFGITGASSLADLARAVAEGVCFADRHILEVFEQAGAPVKAIIATGGGTRGEMMRQIRTDVLGCEMRFSATTDASALGAALLGAIAAGVHAGPREAAAVARNAATCSRYLPDQHRRASYEKPYSVYTRLYPRLKDLF